MAKDDHETGGSGRENEDKTGGKDKPQWTLDVQGVKVPSDTPTIKARDAISRAGFNPDQGWIIVLKLAGQKKEQIGLEDDINLTRPGIERLRLTQAQIDNGEAPPQPRYDFALLEMDEAYLDGRGLRWEAILDGTRRWLIIRNYVLPAGYTCAATDIAMEVPVQYPDAQIDMFYVRPALGLTSGAVIPQTQITENIEGQAYQRWSRHRGAASAWRPEHDSVMTHMSLIEEALLREVGQ